MPFVVDNTNVTRAERQKYLTLARHRKYTITGYHFQSSFADAITRNSTRQGKANIPEVGIKSTISRTELPTLQEGYDKLFFVKLENNIFHIQDQPHEI